MSKPAAQTIAIHHYACTRPGPRLAVFGAIHGDEVCGPNAIAQVLPKFESGELELVRGEVKFVPVCNPAAHAAGRRYVDENLNRTLKRREHPANAEQALANQLAPVIEWADYLLDLHSISSEGEPFSFQDYSDDKSAAFVAAQGVSPVLVGWPEIYADDSALEDGSTQAFASTVNTTSVTVECGNHQVPSATDVALDCIYRSLSFLKLVDRPFEPREPALRVRMKSVTAKAKEGGFVQDWAHLDPVRTGDVIATYSDGETLTASEDGFVIMPHATAEIGDEWFYFGVKA